ncbi:MAG: TIGR00282 family metallophosphoesterase [Planctomycetes bacterium]|nr:TIGR00282 family metallophosphoesterase [Planctomycetota bacterium]
MALKFIMIGDIVGKPGRRVVQQQIDDLKATYQPDLIIANAENIAGGSGITHALYQRLLAYGLDGLTLGDHCFRQKDILPRMHECEKLIRPANLPTSAAGNRSLKLTAASGAELHVITLLGRLFINNPSADDPFAVADAFLNHVGPDARVLVEIHAEATSEKMALAHYLDGRVVAVVGTHTHTPTADARILPGGTAYISDLGMSGPYDSVLGRRKDRVVQFMSTAMPAPFDVAGDECDTRLCGVYIEVDDAGKATRIERVERKADMTRPPFTDAADD